MQDSTSPHSSRSITSRLRRALAGRSGWVLVVAIVGVMVYLQWPILRGVLYPLVGLELPASSIEWREDYVAAFEEAAASDRLMVLDFTASWCPPCQVMNRSTWPDRRVEALMNERFVPVLIDVDEPRNVAMMNTYGIQAIPTILVVDAAGQTVARGGYMTPRGMADFLEKHAPTDG